MLVRKPVGTVGVKHIEAIIGYDNALCKCLATTPYEDLTRAEVFTVVPLTLDIAKVDDFRHATIGGAVDYLPAYLARTLDAPDRVLLFDDVMASPGDPDLRDCCGLITVGGEIYHGVTHERATEENLNSLIWATSVPWHFLCVVIQASGVKRVLLENGDLDCGTIGAQWRELIVGAFDGEGFIHCVRRSPGPAHGSRQQI